VGKGWAIPSCQRRHTPAANKQESKKKPAGPNDRNRNNSGAVSTRNLAKTTKKLRNGKQLGGWGGESDKKICNISELGDKEKTNVF